MIYIYANNMVKNGIPPKDKKCQPIREPKINLIKLPPDKFERQAK